MDRLPGATSLARALLALDRSGATGVLTVQAGHARARISVVEGTPRAVVLEGEEDAPLGDLLARDGALDPRVHAWAMVQAMPEVPVGRWLVAVGAASAPAVAHALRVQLRRRVRRIFQWRDAELRFQAGSPEVGAAPLEEPVAVGDLVLGGMRDAVGEVPLEKVRRHLGDGMLTLTPLGEALLARAALWPAEAAMVPLLRRGVQAEVALAVAAGSSRGLRTLYALKLLHAVAAPGAADAVYPLLLRKHRQVRRHEAPEALLDLDGVAGPEDARRALRRLAGALHPDRFDGAAPEGVRAASTEVMTALVSAEAALRSRSR
jgi:hypothetical protein